MGIIQLGQSLVSYTKLNYMRNSAIEGQQPNEISSADQNNLPASSIDNNLSFTEHLRSRVRGISHSNSEKVGRMDKLRSRNGMFHKTRNILRNISKLMEKFSKGDFDSEDVAKLQKKMDKYSMQLGKVAMKLGDPSEGPVVDPAIGDIDAVPIDPLAEPDIVPDEPVVSAVLVDTSPAPTETPVITDTSVPTDEVSTEPVPSGEEIPVGEETPVGDINLEELGLENINIEDQAAVATALTNVENAIGGFDGAIESFSYEHFRLETSLTFFELPENFHYADDGDSFSYTSMQMSLDYTRLEIMTDTGASIRAQTMSLNFEIVNLLY